MITSETYTPQRMSPEARRALGREVAAVAQAVFNIDEEVFIRGQFEADCPRSRVLVHRGPAGQVVGFFTLHFVPRQIRGEEATVLRVMVGMLREYRGSRSNIGWSLREVLWHLLTNPGRPLFGLGLTVHPTTYMMVHRYVDEFWPKPDEAVPIEIITEMCALADTFGWVGDDPERPLIRRTIGSSQVTEAERSYWLQCDKPAARFYATFNPGFPEGEGLVTFARLRTGMFLRAGRILLADKGRALWERAHSALLATRVGRRLFLDGELRGRLSRVPLFAGLDPVGLELLVKRSALLSLPAGHRLFNQGDLGDALYVISQGAIYVQMRQEPLDTTGGAEGGEEPILDQVGAGTFFGEVATLCGGRRTASVKTAIPSALIHIPGDALRSLMMLKPDIGDAVWSAFAERILEDHARRAAPPREAPLARRERQVAIRARVRAGHQENLTAEERTLSQGEAVWVVLRGAAELEPAGPDDQARHLQAPAVIQLPPGGAALTARTELRLLRLPA